MGALDGLPGADRGGVVGDGCPLERGKGLKSRSAEKRGSVSFHRRQTLHEPVAWYGPIVLNTPGGVAQRLRGIRKGDVHQETAGPGRPVSRSDRAGSGLEGARPVQGRMHRGYRSAVVESVCDGIAS